MLYKVLYIVKLFYKNKSEIIGTYFYRKQIAAPYQPPPPPPPPPPPEKPPPDEPPDELLLAAVYDDVVAKEFIALVNAIAVNTPLPPYQSGCAPSDS